ncbi:RHS repeat-associated core domain-containing protein [Geobacter sp. AOG1]|uniref:RHS repeat-associated core domain-containing protein n=1 Tax=Geobacter sp. AOG1 TaxID=1566346 RepID=UPI001CC5DC9D|nr:RHS repeat-associated core domain-containing protein [Geobacter sp. AOG1]GFE56722.1 hypothetical protein AOG1_06010 [Geobacter sp. AOG1]
MNIGNSEPCVKKSVSLVLCTLMALSFMLSSSAAWGSSANLANGELSHDQGLLSLRGTAMSTTITLYYKSLRSKTGVMGQGWTHSYDIGLTSGSSGWLVFAEGPTSRLYKPSGSIYLSQSGDYSTLVKNADGTCVITEQSGLTHRFDPAGKIVSRTDKNGNTMTFAYTGGNLTGITDGAGRTTTLAYDANNVLTSITDPKGNVYSFAYTTGLLSSVTNPDGGQWSYTYDVGGFILTKTDPAGRATTYTYDANHKVISGTDPAGIARSVVYPSLSASASAITTFTEADGGIWTYNNDRSKGTLTSKTDPYLNVTSYTYDANRNMLTKTEPVVGTTTYTYDANGNMTSEKNPLNQTTTYTYNGLGQVLTSSGPQGTTTNTYDGSGNLLTATDAANATTTYEYDAKGNMTKITTAKGQVTTMTYDSAGFLASTTDPTGAVTTSTYDANGNLATQTDPAGKVTTFEYDGMNRLTKVTDPLGNVTTYGYDKRGNRTTVTDANGNTTTSTYNDEGQVLTSTDAQGNVTTYTYGTSGCTSCGGGVGKLTALTDAKGQTTNWQYDLLGRLTRETDPLQKNTAYQYDPAGNMILRTDANGVAISYGYDPLKRLTGKGYPDGSSLTYTYDTTGRIQTAANGNVSYTYAYDAAGRTTSVTDSRGYTTTYEYDQVGNRTKMTFQPGTADQRVTTYAYDDAGRLTGITSPAGTFTYGYDTLGRRTSLAYPNQVTASYGYDDGGRLTSLTHAAGGNTIASFTYTLDKVGNRTSKAAAELETYAYDLVYRLLTVTATKPEVFSYDAVGNRQTGPGAKDTGYLYNAGNQMTQGRRLAYGYDNAGNQTTRTVAGATDRSWTQSWDYENRLATVTMSKGAETRIVTFLYDSQGRRTWKQLTTTVDGVAATSSWRYVYDNDNILLEIYTDPSGAVEKTFYTHGANVDEHLALERNGQFYYYHADGLGSVTTITDANHNVVQSYAYDSFGMVKPATGFRNSYTYTGREWDKETGLYYYRARYYDPMEGRLISKDPISFAGGDVNLYGYVQNNPINYIDPTGLATVTSNPYIDADMFFDYVVRTIRVKTNSLMRPLCRKACEYYFDKIASKLRVKGLAKECVNEVKPDICSELCDNRLFNDGIDNDVLDIYNNGITSNK